VANDVKEQLDKYYKAYPVPLVFADAFIGVASAHGVERLTLVQNVFNPDSQDGKPMIVPVCHLAIPTEQLVGFCREIIELHEKMVKATATPEGNV
jgi:hypothetical protein